MIATLPNVSAQTGPCGTDTEAPTLVCSPITLPIVNCQVFIPDLVGEGFVSVDDDCSEYYSSQVIPEGLLTICSDLMTPIEVTASDANGNSSSCLVPVILTGTCVSTAPVISCPSSITVQPDLCGAVMPDMSSQVSVTGGSTVTFSQSTAIGASFTGTASVVVTASNASGSSTYCTVSVTATPVAPPVVNITSVSTSGNSETPTVTITATIASSCSSYYPYDWVAIDPNAVITAIPGVGYAVTANTSTILWSVAPYISCPSNVTISANPVTCCAEAPGLMSLAVLPYFYPTTGVVQTNSPLASCLSPGTYYRTYLVAGFHLVDGVWTPFARSCTQKITVLPAQPNVEITPSTTGSVCCGSQVDLCVSLKSFCTTSACPTYVWSNGSTAPCIKVTVNSTTTYIVTVTFAPGVTKTAAYTVYVTPCTVTANSVTNVGLHKATFKFTGSPCASHYIIERRHKVSGGWSVWGYTNTIPAGSTQYEYTDLGSLGKYQVRIKAVCCSTESAWSNFRQFVAVPGGLVAPDQGDTANSEQLDDAKETTTTAPITATTTAKLELLLAPNPSDGIFEAKVSGASDSEAQIRVLNMTGQVIEEQALSCSEDGAAKVSLDASLWPTGLYLIQVFSGGEVSSSKFIKQ